MYLLASLYATEKSSEKDKTLALQAICKHLDIPVRKVVEAHQRHLTIDGGAFEQILKVNAIQNFCAYNEIVLQTFPLVPENHDFWQFVRENS